MMLSSSSTAQPLDDTTRRRTLHSATSPFLLGKLHANTRIALIPFPPQSRPTNIIQHSSNYQNQPSLKGGNLFLSLTSPPMRGVQTRWMSTNGGGSKERKEASTSSSEKTKPQQDNAPVEGEPPPSSSSTMESLRTEASKAVRQRVEQVEERLSKVLHDVAAVSTGDQLAVAAIVMLLIGLVAAPYVIREMKRSTTDYDGLADTDDPVDDFTQLARGEWEQQPDRVSALENILSELVQSKALQQAAQQFVLQIVQAPEVKQALQRLLVSLWTDLVEDPETIKQVIHLLQIVIQDEQIKAAAVKLVLDVVAEPEVQQSLVEAVQKLGVDPQVQKTLQILLTNTAHQTLNDGEVLDHSMEFATDVLGDDVVQQTAGQALRNTLHHAFRPAATMGLTATGVALMLFGVLALGYARSSEYEARLLDSAARSLQTNAAYGMQRLLTWPARVLQRVGSWIASSCLNTWQNLSSGVVNATGNLGQWMARSVAYTGRHLMSVLGQTGQQLAGSVLRTLQVGYQTISQVLGSVVMGALHSIQHVWATSNDSLLQWSWSMIRLGRKLSWQLTRWVSALSFQEYWQWLTESLMGRFVSSQ